MGFQKMITLFQVVWLVSGYGIVSAVHTSTKETIDQDTPSKIWTKRSAVNPQENNKKAVDLNMLLNPANMNSIEEIVSSAALPKETIDQIIASVTMANRNAMERKNDPTNLFDLDMILTPEQWHAMEDLPIRSSEAYREKRQAISNRKGHWPNKRIPFKVAPSAFSQNDVYQIQMAINEWQEKTCLKFEPAQKKDTNYVLFQDGNSCSSNVGMLGGVQQITLSKGCRVKSIIVHEIGHAIGFYHQHSRPDRDNYVEIALENVKKGHEFNFKKLSFDAAVMYGPYDYRSIMHYGGTGFSSNGKPTIKTKYQQYQNIIGKNFGLSSLDIRAANVMYGCFGHL